MAIHRKEKWNSYTIADNEILRGKQLSATAKMVLLICLSLPEDWKFNIRGLCTFTKERPDAIARAIRELEKAGYMERRFRRDPGGKVAGIMYEIYETPQKRGEADAPHTEKPESEKPKMDSPEADGLEKESSPLPIKDLSIKELPIKELPIIHDTNHPSTNQTEEMEERIRKQIEYDIMCQRYDVRLLNDIVSVIVSVMVCRGETISLGKETVYPAEYVRSRLLKIGPMHIEQLMETLIRNQPVIRNVRAYLLTALINTANTMDMGYQWAEE